MDNEHLSESERADCAGMMAIIIHDAFCNADPKYGKYIFDALIRVFVYLAKSQGMSQKSIEEEISTGIQYYYTKD